MINDINYNKLNLKTIILHAVMNKGFVTVKVKQGINNFNKLKKVKYISGRHLICNFIRNMPFDIIIFWEIFKENCKARNKGIKN